MANTIEITLKEGCVMPIPMQYEVIGEAEQGDNLIVGNLYSLQGDECDGFKMPIRVYSCKGLIPTFKGVNLDAVVMKQVEGEEDTIFSLTRQDCKILGLEYEDKLQLFPISFNWNPLVRQETREYTCKDLSTYKPSPIDGTIRNMHIFLGFIRYYDNKNCITPNGIILPIDFFLNSIKIEFKNEALKRHQIMFKPMLSNGEGSHVVDMVKNGINLMLFFSTHKDIPGIDPRLFQGKSFDDIFKVSWREPFTITEIDERRLPSRAAALEFRNKIRKALEYNDSMIWQHTTNIRRLR